MYQTKKIFILLSFSFFLTSSCNSTFDCPEKTYRLNIALENHTGFAVDVQLFPTAVQSENLYRASDIGGGFKETHFSMGPQQNNQSNFSCILYTTGDTSVNPADLLSLKFISIQLTVNDSSQSQIVLSPDTIINSSQNPFAENTAWVSHVINSDMPDNDCPNPGETNSYHFYIESLVQ